jgi:hypothetical protein
MDLQFKTYISCCYVPANKFLVVFGGGSLNWYFGNTIGCSASEGANAELNLNNSGDVIEFVLQQTQRSCVR